MGFENCKNATQFQFVQPKNTPWLTPFIGFGLNVLAKGRVILTVEISVVVRPLNFSFFNKVKRWFCFFKKLLVSCKILVAN